MHGQHGHFIALFAVLVLSSVHGQDAASLGGNASAVADSPSPAIAVEQTLGAWAGLSSTGPTPQHVQGLWLRALAGDQDNSAIWMRGFPFASADGQYAAQNEAEIKTYERLKMGFEFIERPYIRRQLQLPAEEGLFVVQADSAGEGYQLGFREGDLILRLDDTPIDTQYDFVIKLTEQLGNDQDVEIHRDGQPLKLTLRLESQPDDEKQYVLGVSVDEISDLIKTQLRIDAGVAVTSVSDDSAAGEAGLCPHDVIVALGDKPVGSMDELKTLVQASQGEPVEVSLVRGGKRLTIEITPRAVEQAAAPQFSTDYYELHAAEPHRLALVLDHVLLGVQPRLSAEFHGTPPDPSLPPADQLQAILERLQSLEQKVDQLVK